MTPEFATYIGPQLDYIIFWWVLIPALVVTIVGFGISVWLEGHVLDHWTGWVGLIGALGVGTMLIMAPILHVPLQSKYWANYEVTGTIAELSNTLEQGSGNLSGDSYLIKLESIDEPLTTTNPRLLDAVGEDVTLRCNILWEYQAADKWACEIR